MKEHVAARAFAALSNSARLTILRVLIKRGSEGMNAGEIGTAVKLEPATLSFHLAHLRDADLVRSRREGRFIRYASNPGAMAALGQYLAKSCRRSDGR